VSFAIDRLRGGKNGSDAGMKLLVALRVAMRREEGLVMMDSSIMKNRLELSNWFTLIHTLRQVENNNFSPVQKVPDQLIPRISADE